MHQQITTSCLVSQFQTSCRTFETLGRELKVSAEDLDFGLGFESGFEDQSTFPRPRFLGSDIRPRVSSNLVYKLTRQKKTSAINIHWQVSAPSCLPFGFQISGHISKTPGRGSRGPVKGLSFDLQTSLLTFGQGS